MANKLEYFNEALNLFQDKQYARAVKALHEIELDGAFSPEALDLKALCYILLEKYEDAFVSANMALKFEKHAELYGRRGHALHGLGLFEEAAKDYERGANLGNEACHNNIGLALNDNYHQMRMEAEKALRGEIDIDLDNYFFISNRHNRYENGTLVKENLNTNRAIRVKANIECGANYTMMVYNLDQVHPIWKTYLQVSPKQMKVKDFTVGKVELIGYGNDNRGASFSDYGLTIDQNNDTVTLKVFDRNFEVKYFKGDVN